MDVGEDLRVSWTARRSNQSIRKEINPEYSLEGLMLKLQYFGHLIRRADSLEKTLMLGMIEGMRRKGVKEDEMAGLNGHEFERAPGDAEGQARLVPPDFSVHGDSPGKHTVVSCHPILQGIFPTQGSNPVSHTARRFFTV